MIISIEGHSGLAKPGEDIVCAGISALAYTLLNCLLDEEASENIKFIKKHICDGYMYIEFKPFCYSKSRISGIVDALITGFLMLEENYPDYIKSV